MTIQRSSGAAAVVAAVALACAGSASGAAPPTLRPAAGVAPQVTRSGTVATVVVAFTVSKRARLDAWMNALGSIRPLTLLAGTSLAGTRAAVPRVQATALVRRAGTYRLSARIDLGRVARGQTLSIRLLAVDTAGRRATLTIPVRA